jgi:hypothetical protein
MDSAEDPNVGSVLAAEVFENRGAVVHPNDRVAARHLSG